MNCNLLYIQSLTKKRIKRYEVPRQMNINHGSPLVIYFVYLLDYVVDYSFIYWLIFYRGFILHGIYKTHCFMMIYQVHTRLLHLRHSLCSGGVECEPSCLPVNQHSLSDEWKDIIIIYYYGEREREGGREGGRGGGGTGKLEDHLPFSLHAIIPLKMKSITSPINTKQSITRLVTIVIMLPTDQDALLDICLEFAMSRLCNLWLNLCNWLFAGYHHFPLDLDSILHISYRSNHYHKHIPDGQQSVPFYKLHSEKVLYS